MDDLELKLEQEELQNDARSGISAEALQHDATLDYFE
jgi:hypothetical protein